MFVHKLAELREGELESECDAWLRDSFYPIVAGFTVPDNCELKSVVYRRMTKFGNEGIMDWD